MRDLNDAIADVETDIGQVQAQLAARGDQCRELIKEQEALHGRVRDDFNALARLQAEAATDAPPMLARDLLQQSSADLQRRDRKAAVLDGELQALLDIEQSLQQRSQEAVAARDAAGGRWQALQDQVDTTLEAEPTYRALQDDLQLAVMQHASDMEFRLAETPEVDAIIERYINEMLVLTAGDDVLPGKVTARGIDEADIVDEVMWWYRVEYSLDESVERVHVSNRLLFNVFEDQRNLIHLKTRRGRERAWSFSWSDDNVTMRLN